MRWSSTDPRWWAFSIRPVDFLFGQDCRIAEETRREQSISVLLPEKVYTGELRLYRISHKRPRWPTTTHINRYSIDMDEPIPIPGKGESSWDCGEDAIYSISGVASSADRAIISLLDSVNTSRVRYGGSVWLPENARPETREWVDVDADAGRTSQP